MRPTFPEALELETSLPYRAPRWLPGRHAQSIYPYLFLRTSRIRYRRERVATPDGDFVDFDWLGDPENSVPSPVVILFHGLEGSSRSPYATSILGRTALRGWRGVVPHWRGCSGQPNRLPRAYHSGDHAEVRWMLKTVLSRAAGAPAFALGISLGASALLNWLGREPDVSRAWLRGAASVSAPLDLVSSGHALDRGSNRIYGRNFLRTLVPKALEKERRFPGLFDRSALRKVRFMREFDDLVTAPLHGFRGVDDYWIRASSKPHLGRIALATLVLNARNDPFVPGASLPGPEEVSRAVTLDQPQEGGHVGFVQGPFPGSLRWLSDRVLGFFDARLRDSR